MRCALCSLMTAQQCPFHARIHRGKNQNPVNQLSMRMNPTPGHHSSPSGHQKPSQTQDKVNQPNMQSANLTLD
jgi:hypothetical protein